MNEITTRQVSSEIAEKVLLGGDLSKMSPTERVSYYQAVCESVGLNPLTQPFDYLQLNGKTQLYAKRNCTDQLRKIHHVSVSSIEATERAGLYIVVCKVQDSEGRTDASTGAVSVGGLKGDALANAIMKAETKAKRRATLSICGLSFMDETELDTVPAAKPVSVSHQIPEDKPEATLANRIKRCQDAIANADKPNDGKRSPMAQLEFIAEWIVKQSFDADTCRDLSKRWILKAFSLAATDEMIRSIWSKVEGEGFDSETVQTLFDARASAMQRLKDIENKGDAWEG